LSLVVTKLGGKTLMRHTLIVKTNRAGKPCEASPIINDVAHIQPIES
jgi:hypothetical protein